MKKNINLLPQELAAGKGATRALGILIKATMSVGALVILMGVLGGAGIYFLSDQQSKLDQDLRDLRQKVRSLESTETGLVLTRDRLAKVGEVLSARTVEPKFQKHLEIIEAARGDVLFRESNIGASRSSLSLEIKGSIAMSDLFDSFFASQSFTKLQLNSLQFSPFSGYRMELEVL